MRSNTRTEGSAEQRRGSVPVALRAPAPPQPQRSASSETSGCRVTIQLPWNEPRLVFEGTNLTATAEGVFTDYWEKLQ